MKVFLTILFGVLGGVLGGMGMGGGTLLIPLLTIGLHFTQQNAQAINLIAFLPMSVVALIIHFKNKLVNYKIAIPIIITGIISSIASSYLATIVDSSKLSIYFGIFLIVTGVIDIILLFAFKKKSNKADNKIKKTKNNKS
ncbi:MAG TPA: sulfite exporter TauE/SafE family protein [Clostridiales bacterium]|nr:sulfite exporter TauE/SafE family protein [Clostridiales bacterium]